MLNLYNTLTRQKEAFNPIEPGKVKMYVCGMTVYDLCHIGHARMMMAFDVVYRWLLELGYQVTYVRNITDIEDKIIKRAVERGISIRELTDEMIAAMHRDFAALGTLPPTHEPRATDYVPQMIEFAKGIADKHCYELESGLYFDVSTVADYGRLARANTEEGEGRIEAVEGKRNAADFAIWRKTPAGEKRQMAPPSMSVRDTSTRPDACSKWTNASG